MSDPVTPPDCIETKQASAARSLAIGVGMAGGIPFGAAILATGDWWWVAGLAVFLFLESAAEYAWKLSRLYRAAALGQERGQ